MAVAMATCLVHATQPSSPPEVLMKMRRRRIILMGLLKVWSVVRNLLMFLLRQNSSGTKWRKKWKKKQTNVEKQDEKFC